MNRTHRRYLLIAGGALVVGLLVSGTPVQSLLPLLLLLACPLMMMVMMRGMSGHGHRQQDQPLPRTAPPEHDDAVHR
jgi:hypothetical protein